MPKFEETTLKRDLEMMNLRNELEQVTAERDILREERGFLCFKLDIRTKERDHKGEMAHELTNSIDVLHEKLKTAEDRTEQAVLLAMALSDGSAGDLGPEGSIRKIINRLQAAEGLAEAASLVTAMPLEAPAEPVPTPLALLVEAIAAWDKVTSE